MNHMRKLSQIFILVFREEKITFDTMTITPSLPIMTRDEFELRFTAYRGMKTRFKLDWDDDMLVRLSKKNNK